MIGFAGLSHLGIVSSAAAAAKGFDVVAYDPDASLCVALKQANPPVVEPGLISLLRDGSPRIRYAADASALAHCDVIYISVDVPTDAANRSDIGPVRELLRTASEVAKPGATLVVLSQVRPGFSRKAEETIEPIEQKRLQLYYQVETLVFGNAVERALRPERFIVGCADPGVTLPEAFYSFLKSFGCPILPMRYESAELAKIAINCCLVAAVSTANTLAGLCEKIGADWSEIVPALRLDRRIGEHAYLAAGLGIAGGNLERDLATVTRLGDSAGTDVGVVRAWSANSRYRRDWVLRLLHATTLAHHRDSTLALLGLAYKENTNSIKNAPALSLLAALTPYRIQAYDPLVAPQPEWHPRLSRAADALAACAGVDAVVVMTPWPEFRTLDPRTIAGVSSGKTVIDPFGCLDREACRAAGLTHFVLGVGNIGEV